MSPTHQTIRQFRKQLALLLFLKYTVVFGACWLFIWGTAVLAFRAAGLLSVEQLYAGAGGLLLPPLIALLFVRRNLPSDAVLGAILDRNNKAGGLFLTSLETDTSGWDDVLPPLAVPELAWKGGRSWFSLLLGAVFLLVALSVPVKTLTASAGYRLNIEDRVQKLTKQLDALAEEKLMTMEEVETRKMELEKIQKDAEGVSPVKTLDALDHLADQLEKKAQEALEETEKKAETLAKAESLLDNIDEKLQKSDETTNKEMIEGLAEAMEKMLAENESLREELSEELGKESGGDSEKNALSEALQKMLQENKLGEMTPEQMRQLAEAMKNCEGGCERMLENLKRGGFNVDPEMLKKLEEARQIGKADLQKLLDELKAGAGTEECGDCEGCKTLSRCEKQDQWDRSAKETSSSQYLESQTEEDGKGFRPLTLPPPEWEAFRDSQRIGISKGRPQALGAGNPNEQGGALRDIEGGSGSAHGQAIYPRHRGATGRYFSRDGQ